MMRILKNIFKLLRMWQAAHIFEESWDLLARDKAVDAEALFEKGEHLLKHLPYEHKIMKGVIKFRLRKRDECIELYKNAWTDLNKDNTLSMADKMYLKYYMYGDLIIYNNFLGTSLEGTELVTASDVPLKKVSANWKRRFPYRDHPDWDKYGV